MVSIKEPAKSLNRCFFISITLILDGKMARMFFFLVMFVFLFVLRLLMMLWRQNQR